MMRCERIMVGAIGVLTVASIGIGCRAYMLKPEPHDVSADRMTTMPEEVWKPEYDIPATEYAYITDEQLAEIEAQEAQSVEDALLARATRIDNVTVTHYCICQKCCGKSPDHPAYGITASGRYATPYVSVAVDPSVIPLGSDVLVDYGDGVIEYYRADDTGSGVGGKHIDLCVSDHQEARNLGVRTATVYVVPPEN